MKSIFYVGMDVHKEYYIVCIYRAETDRVEYYQRVEADYRQVLKYLEEIRRRSKEEIEFVCGYEAGCLGYTLYHQLTSCGIRCEILAPTSMGIVNTNRVKTDKRDAGNVAKCLAFHTYSAVHIPTEEDESVKEYMRMRDDQKKALKIIKQQLLSLVLRQGHHFTDGTKYWTGKHLKWLHGLELKTAVLQETLVEYLLSYQYLTDKLQRLDERIEELASGERYQKNVKKLSCFLGVKTHTALAVLVETGDFSRFSGAEKYAAYLGLVPSENSSGGKQSRGGITKAGNSHLRRLLVESAQAYTRGQIGYKSADLGRRQKGNEAEVIAYANKANERLRRKFYKLVLRQNKKRNIAATAIARELACFMWGIMTDNIA